MPEPTYELILDLLKQTTLALNAEVQLNWEGKPTEHLIIPEELRNVDMVSADVCVARVLAVLRKMN